MFRVWANTTSPTITIPAILKEREPSGEEEDDWVWNERRKLPIREKECHRPFLAHPVPPEVKGTDDDRRLMRCTYCRSTSDPIRPGSKPSVIWFLFFITRSLASASWSAFSYAFAQQQKKANSNIGMTFHVLDVGCEVWYRMNIDEWVTACTMEKIGTDVYHDGWLEQ